MPIFEYRCRECENEFEYLVLPSTPNPECPSCQSHELERLVSLFGTATDSAERSRMKDFKKKRQEYQHDRMQTERRLRNED